LLEFIDSKLSAARRESEEREAGTRELHVVEVDAQGLFEEVASQ